MDSIGLIDVNSYDLDIFQLETQYGGVKTLQAISKNVLNYYDFLDELGIDDQSLKTFVRKCGEGYREENPYHNATHAADVL